MTITPPPPPRTSPAAAQPQFVPCVVVASASQPVRRKWFAAAVVVAISTGFMCGVALLMTTSTLNPFGGKPDIHSLANTQRWAQKSDGNQLVIDDQIEVIKKAGAPLLNQIVDWDIPVKDVTDTCVFLQGTFDGLIFKQEDTPPQAWQAMTMRALFNEPVVALGIGRDISAAEARSLKAGDSLAVNALVKSIDATQRIQGNSFERRRATIGYAIILTLGAAHSAAHTPSTETADEQEDVKEEVLKISIATLREANQNELAAQKTYGNKRVQVTGRLTGNLFGVWLVDAKDPSAMARLYFRYDSGGIKGTDTEKHGVLVTMIGTCTFDGNAINLTDCVMVTSPKEIERQVKAKQTATDEAKVRAAEALEAEVRSATAVIPQKSNGYFFDHDQDTFYKYKVVKITGTVERLRPIASEALELTVFSTEADTSATCRFRLKYQSQLEKLKPGQTVTVRGAATFWFHRKVTLENCVMEE